jgi:hypothetical protein
MAKYQVDTDHGSYIVETEDAPSAPPAAAARPSTGPRLKGTPTDLSNDDSFLATIAKDFANLPTGAYNAVRHPIDTINGVLHQVQNLPEDLSTDIEQGKWGKLAARAVELGIGGLNEERLKAAADAAETTGKVAVGAAKGAYDGAMAPSTLKAKVKGIPIEVPTPVPASVTGAVAGATTGGTIGRMVGHPVPGAVIGGTVGAAVPAIKGAIRGGKSAAEAWAAAKAAMAEKAAVPALEAGARMMPPAADTSYVRSTPATPATVERPQLGPGPIVTPPPADPSGIIPGWSPTILSPDLPPQVLAELTRDSEVPAAAQPTAPPPAGPLPTSPQPAAPAPATPSTEGPQFPGRNGTMPEQMPGAAAKDQPAIPDNVQQLIGPRSDLDKLRANFQQVDSKPPAQSRSALQEALDRQKATVEANKAKLKPQPKMTMEEAEQDMMATPAPPNELRRSDYWSNGEKKSPEVIAEEIHQFNLQAKRSRLDDALSKVKEEETAAQAKRVAILKGQPRQGGTIPASVQEPIVNPSAKVNNEADATRQPGRQPASQEQAIPQSGGSGDSSRYGEASQVRVPGENRAYQARYALRELSEVTPSHNPSTLQNNPEYAYSNDRNYADPRNAERIVKQTAEFDPNYLVSDSPDATNGAPIIDQKGNVLGGNSRTMTLARVYQGRPEAAAAYKALLTKKAAQFGLDPARVAGMKQPILVRELSHEISPESAQPIITDLNKTGTASLTGAERAIADSNKISPTTMNHMAGMIESQGPDGTLAKALEGKGGAFIADQLVKDGVITTQEKPGLFDASGNITAAAKDRISKLMLGRVFKDSEQFEGTPPAVRNKLERIMAPLSRVAGKPEWDITPDVREAVDMLERARATGSKNLDDLVAQQGLFGGGEFSPRAVALAKMIQSKGPVDLAKAFARYANDSKGPTMFGEAAPADAFGELTGAPPEPPPAPKFQNKLKPPKK